MVNMKIVRYDAYCPICAHYKESETSDICNECLSTPARESSQVPINFKFFKDARVENTAYNRKEAPAHNEH